MKKKMNYSYKEHEFWLFFCTKNEILVFLFESLKHHRYSWDS